MVNGEQLIAPRKTVSESLCGVSHYLGGGLFDFLFFLEWIAQKERQLRERPEKSQREQRESLERERKNLVSDTRVLGYIPRS